VLPLRATVLAVLAAFVLAGCGGPKGVPSSDAAVVGGQVVPKWRVDNLLAQAKVNYASQSKGFPAVGSLAYETLKQRATGYLVVGAMYLDAGKSLGITVSNSDVNAALAQIRQQTYGGSATKQEAAWKAQGTSAPEAFEEERLHLAEQRIERKLLTNIKITPSDLQSFYNQNKAHFSVPESRSVRMILVHSMPLAQSIEAKLKAGANFEQLVAKYSEDASSKAKKGALVVARGQGDAAFENVVFSTKLGQISKPVLSPDHGIRIITPLGPAQPPRYTPLSEIKDILRMQLADQQRQTAVSKWQTQVKTEYCGKKVKYAKGYTPSPDNDPCGANSTTPPVTSG